MLVFTSKQPYSWRILREMREVAWFTETDVLDTFAEMEEQNASLVPLLEALRPVRQAVLAVFRVELWYAGFDLKSVERRHQCQQQHISAVLWQVDQGIQSSAEHLAALEDGSTVLALGYP